MWLLKKHSLSQNDSDDVVQYYLLHGRKYVLGRKDCDIVLAGDASISRKHAVITITKNDPEKPSTISIIDLSKIGVYVNEKKIVAQTETELHNGDLLCLGKMRLKFQLKYYDLVVVMSCINNNQTKSTIKNHVQTLGGYTKADWVSEATHLVMEKLTFTIKVVCAIACGKTIVTPKFIEDLVDCCDKKKGQQLPSEQSYLPPITEQSLLNQEHLFFPNTHRKSLLDGKLFIALTTKQYKRIKQAVENAGGKIILKDKEDTNLFHDLSSNQTMVIQAESKDLSSATSNQKTWVNVVYSKVKSNNLRVIRESEIGLSILHISIEQFCNPTTSSAPSLIGTTHTQALTDTMMETQPLHSQPEDNTHIIDKVQDNTPIIGKVQENTPIIDKVQDNTPSIDKVQENEAKRKREDMKTSSSEDETLFKKPKLDNLLKPGKTNNVGNSRKHSKNIIALSDNGDDLYLAETINNTDSKKHCKDIVEIGDDDEFNLVESESIKNSVPKKKNNTSQKNIPFDDTIESDRKTNISSWITKDTNMPENESQVFEKNTNLVATPKSNGSNLLLFTPSSKKPVPDTYPSNEPKKQFLDFDDGDDDDDDPFSFDVPMPSGLENIHDVVKNVIGNSQSQSDSMKINADLSQDETNDRFSKAVASTQESDGEYLLSPDEKVDLVLNDDGLLSKVESNSGVSYEDMNVISEEFPVVKQRKTNFVKLEGFISTVNKKSTIVIPKEDPDLDGIDRDLVTTEFVNLVFKAPKTKQIINALKATNKKNYKTFKKQHYVGKGKSYKSYISDLIVFESNNEERENLFADLREENEREEQESRQMDQMFDFGDQKKKQPGRR